MAVMTLHHGSERLAGSGVECSHLDRCGHHLTDRSLARLAAAQRQAAQHVSFSENSGNAFVVVNHGNRAYMAIQHCPDGLLGRGFNRNGSAARVTHLEEVHGSPLLSRPKLVLEYLAVLHNEADIAQNLNVGQRIAGDSNHIGVGARGDHADFSLLVEKLCPPRGSALNRLHRRHPEFDQPWELLRDRISPWKAAGISTKSDFHPSLERLAE